MSELNVDTIAGSGGTTVTIKSGHTLTLVANMNAATAKITNLGDPSSAQDAATKNYVDTQLLTLDTIGELTDVTITSVADNEVLAYDSSSGLWINQTASEAGLATSGNLTTHTSATTNPHTVTVDQVFAGGIPTGDLNINSNKLTNVTNPSSAQDAATKNYVDTQVQTKDALSELSGTSDDVAEGTTNLYFTNERVDDRFNSLFQDGTALTGTYDDASNTYTLNLDSLTVSEFAASAIVLESEGIGSNDNDTTLPTSAAVKDYVDTQLTGSDLDFQGDSGGALSIDLDSETLDIAGGTGIDTTGSGNQITVDIDSTVATLSGSQTLTNKDIDSDNNTITNIVDADIKAAAAIDATKIADGTVTSTEFQYINTLSSNAQTQLDAKATTSNTLDEFGNPAAALDINDQEITKFVAKDFREDIATTSDSGTSFSSNTLTLDVQDGNVFSITLDDNVTTWAISNMGAGTTITAIIKQDGTGSRLMNATQINSTTFKTVGAGGLTLSTAASAIDIVSVFYDGTDYLVFSQLNMS